ncbi:uncharacterized protein LOC135208307 [Macrobrachium nipponense]|uniref:uncharacterized protein LOC135208307 n=1 Tax=Macrobrachium nipponense TaxID=159736 RepID=UPI0030C8C279
MGHEARVANSVGIYHIAQQSLLTEIKAQSETWCRCAVFATFEFAQEMVWEGEEIAIDSCEDEAQQCKNSCVNQVSSDRLHLSWFLFRQYFPESGLYFHSTDLTSLLFFKLNAISNGGDLWHMCEDGVTVGQHVCDSLVGLFHHFVQNHYVYGYYEICGGAWQYTGLSSKQMLCCEGGQHVHCIS